MLIRIRILLSASILWDVFAVLRSRSVIDRLRLRDLAPAPDLASVGKVTIRYCFNYVYTPKNKP